MIPRARAEFRWADTVKPPYRIAETIVLDRAEIERRPQIDDSSMLRSLGACCAGWLDPSLPTETPEGVFVEFVRQGFQSADALLQALDAFSMVEGCDWAIEMARAGRLPASDSARPPERVFVAMVRTRFMSDEVLMKALERFSGVDGCAWATKMAAALRWCLDRERS